VSAKPPKTATKKESVVAISQHKVVLREMIEKVEYQIWVQARIRQRRGLFQILLGVENGGA
jgi:hypothetical protein